MKHKPTNLAVISNKTFEAAKVVNLNHYDISSALQTSLEFPKLIANFSQKVMDLVPHTAYIYSNKEFNLNSKQGVFTKHSCSYALRIEDEDLGELKLMRNYKFENAELELLETLLCCLIHPLNNTTLYQRALKLAYTDPLTQVNNRASLNEMMRREMCLAKRHDKNLSILFLDIDHFKAINDERGHECGDIALSSVAKLIKNCMRESDMVFRYGGEEFVVLLSETDIDGATALAERIRQTVANHTLAYNMSPLTMTVSIGVASLQGHDTEDSLVKRADSAMYKAKRCGRNRFMLAD